MKNQNTDLNPNTGAKDGTRVQKKTRTLTDPYRVNISEEAHELIESVAYKVNNGFGGGEVTRSDIANYLLVNGCKSFSDSDVKALRNLHFNERKMLYAVLHNSAKNGELPDELKQALRNLYGVAEQPKKRVHRAAKEQSTDSDVDKLVTA